MHSVKSDVYALRPLHVMGYFLGILPKIISKDEPFIKAGWFQIYPALVMIVYILMYGFMVYGRVIYPTNYLESTVYLLNIASDFCLLLVTIGSIVGVNMINGCRVLKFVRLMRSVDDDFKNVVMEEKHTCRSFYVELCLLHIFSFIHYGYNTYFWLSYVGFDVFKYYSMRDFFAYHTFVLSLVVRHYALSINYRFERVNWMLRRVCRNYDLTEGVFRCSQDWNVKRLTCVYTKLSKCVQNYNCIFGVHFVSLYICIVVNLLSPINIALVYGTGREFSGMTFGTGLIVLCIMWTTFPLIVGSAIFLACDKCTREAAKTSSICYSRIQELADADKDMILEEELWKFAQQARSEKAEFTAAGCFNVNNSILFSLFGSVASYLIVLIQFH